MAASTGAKNSCSCVVALGSFANHFNNQLNETWGYCALIDLNHSMLANLFMVGHR